MRKQLLIAAVVGVVVLAGSRATFAQAPVTSVSIPFQFVVGDTVLPAGSYVVTNVLEGSNTLSVRSADGKSGAVVNVQLADKPTPGPNTKISFVRIAGQCFLSKVSIPGMKAQIIPLPPQRLEAALTRLNGGGQLRGGHPAMK